MFMLTCALKSSYYSTVGKIVLPSSILQFWDLGGQRDIRNIWVKYYDSCHAVAYVVDASDLERLAEGWEVFGTYFFLSSYRSDFSVLNIVLLSQTNWNCVNLLSLPRYRMLNNYRYGSEPSSNRWSPITPPRQQAGFARLTDCRTNPGQLRRMVAITESRARSPTWQATCG